VFCNRSPSDTSPNIDAGLCPYGLTVYSSNHLLWDCPLLATEHATLLSSAVGDIQSLDFITGPENSLALRGFLRTTGLEHSVHLRFEGDYTTIIHNTDDSDSDSPEPDFGTFDN
jgi:hypothetical protein